MRPAHLREVRGDRIEQALRSARPGFALAPIGHELGEPCGAKPARVIAGVNGDAAIARVAIADALELFTEDVLARRPREVHVHDIWHRAARRQRAHHRSDRRDAAARGDEQSADRSAFWHHERAGRFADGEEVADRAREQRIGDPALRLDRDLEAAIAAIRRRADRVRASRDATRDRYAHADVLSRLVGAPASAGPQDQGAHARHLVPHGLDPGLAGVAHRERAKELDVVRRDQRRRDKASDAGELGPHG